MSLPFDHYRSQAGSSLSSAQGLFESDQDLDIALEFNWAIPDQPVDLSLMVCQTDMLAPKEARAFYRTEEYQVQLKETVKNVCNQLDSGLGERFFEMFRARESEYRGKYRVILLGALFMRAGARITPDNLTHLRDLVPEINCNDRFVLPIMDEGFRAPGRAQFLAALDNYTSGTPRCYTEASCFKCGKVEADLGRIPQKCACCMRAWYCSKVFPFVTADPWLVLMQMLVGVPESALAKP